MIVLDAGVLVALAGWALWRRNMRSSRTLVLLGGTLLIFVGVQVLSLAIGIPVRAFTLTLAIWLLLFRNEWFSLATQADVRFTAQFVRELDTLREAAAARRDRTITDGELLEETERTMHRLADLEAPSAAWAATRDRTVKHLEAQAGRIRRALAGDHLQSQELADGEAELEDLLREYRRTGLPEISHDA